ncbi:MAG: L-histidine N(alpha)-methyltransferase [Pirellulales bacterium]
MRTDTACEARDVAAAQASIFLHDVLAGLSASHKRIPCKYFYDKRGSELFDRICTLEEYYPTRTELAIMERHAAEMGAQIGPGAMLVEFGSGSSVKTRYLLDGLPQPVAYVPVDISGEHLYETAAELSLDYPHIEILPVCADFSGDFALPAATSKPTHTAVYFPGSTIGNFLPRRAIALLRRIATLCGTGGGLLIGIDLRKDARTISAAYNDALGVTAEFNLNLLRRINRDLQGDFDLSQFAHRADYDPLRGRVEMYLVSQRPQVVHLGGRTFEFATGETICTEYSHKYSVAEFAELGAAAGLSLHRVWTDRAGYFAVLHLAVEGAAR